MRYEAARSSQQPESAFAIAAKHMVTEVSLPDAGGRQPPDGWSRFKLGGDVVLAAYNTDEPLLVHIPLPNGAYDLIVKMQGRAVIEVDGRTHEVTTGPVTELGEITISDEVFRATLRPQRSTAMALALFGFKPAAAPAEDPKLAAERLQRLESLGYVGD